MQNSQHRPLGVTIIAILTIISGILLLIPGIGLVALGALFSGNSASTSQAVAQFFGIIFAVAGGVLLALGIGYIAMFYGLIKGKGWAWTITIILLIIGIIMQIISTYVITASSLENTKNAVSGVMDSITFPLISLAINIVILYYLYRQHVRAYFGKTKPLLQLQCK
jgi:glucan phosphoethanolaminetransferase (alkaline phosphatase superfamily)